MPTKNIQVHFRKSDDYTQFCDSIKQQKSIKKFEIEPFKLEKSKQSLAELLQSGSVLVDLKLDDPENLAEALIVQYQGKIIV